MNIMTKQGQVDNVVTYEHVCDTKADLANIDPMYSTLGSIAIVLEGESGGLEIYITNSEGEWLPLNISAGGSGEGSNSNIDLSNYLLKTDIAAWAKAAEKPTYTASEVGALSSSTIIPTVPSNVSAFTNDAGYLTSHQDISGKANSADLATVATSGSYNDLDNKPTIPDVSGFYTKPSGGIPASDLASGVIPNVSIYAPKASPVFTGSISMGRKSGSTVGSTSIAIGLDSEATGSSGANAMGWETHATGRSAHAEGQSTRAEGWVAHAEGLQTYASGTAAHAEGKHSNGYENYVTGNVAYVYGATADASHSEGSSTIAAGFHSHAEGQETIAIGAACHTGGKFNVPDNWNNWNEWAANTEYTIDDKVKITGENEVSAYQCTTANSDETFTSSNWQKIPGILNYAEIIGNGTDRNHRSNARTLDWDGNEYLAGDLYVGCSSNSTNGTKLARIPTPPATDGTYTLQATVSNGTITYTWVGV